MNREQSSDVCIILINFFRFGLISADIEKTRLELEKR